LGLGAKHGEGLCGAGKKRGRQEVWTDVSAAHLDALVRIRCPLPVKRCKRLKPK
jgi:hypothetical protein